MEVDEDDIDPDLEDCSEEISKLPLVAFDDEKHFAKRPTYKQEIRHLLRCRGSLRIVQLLGRSEEGMLVFPQIQAILLSYHPVKPGPPREDDPKHQTMDDRYHRWCRRIFAFARNRTPRPHHPEHS